MPVDRTWLDAWLDDSGTGTDGTILDHAAFSVFVDAVDEALDATGGGAPAAHNTTHQSGGSDPIKLDDLATPDDNTDLNASTTRHGLLKKLSGVATEYLDGTGNYSTPSGPANPVRVLGRDVIEAEVVNTTTETNVYSATVPGGTLSTTRCLRITVLADYLNNSGSGATCTIRVKYGATTIGTYALAGVTASATRRSIRVLQWLAAQNSASAQAANGFAFLSAASAGVAGASDSGADGQYSAHSSAAETSSSDQTLAVTVQHGTAASTISLRCKAVFVEVME